MAEKFGTRAAELRAARAEAAEAVEYARVKLVLWADPAFQKRAAFIKLEIQKGRISDYID